MAATVNLRTFPDPKQFDCPHCHHPITIFDPDGSEYVVCPSCQSYCRFIASGHLQVQQPVSPIAETPLLPLGKEGILKGNTYKVIAYMEKKESGTNYEWKEYMLYSYTKGYAFLAEYGGQWSFIAGTQHYPELANAVFDDGAASLDGVEYQQYNLYSPVISALIGEFDWDAYEERVSTREFINPPFMLVREKNKTNERVIDWYFGEYIEPQEIADAFAIDIGAFPDMVDIGANQPNPHKKRYQQSLKLSITALIIMVLLQVLLIIFRPSQLIIDKSVPLALPPAAKQDSVKQDSVKQDSAKKDTGVNATANLYSQPVTNGNFEYQSLRTSSFTINNGPAPVNIDLSAPVDNNWFEATLELVNEKDNQTWVISKEIDYYHGYDDGDSWSEGSTSESVLVDDIPPGKYHINIYPYAGTQSVDHMDIKVTANIILWQNLLITLLILALYPLACWYFQRQFEVNRWMNSDYSPYKKTKSDD